MDRNSNRVFVDTMVPHDASIAVNRLSFNTLCDVVDTIMRAKAGVERPAAVADRLQRLLGDHMRYHVEAYGDAFIRPKHHWMMDIPDQFRRDDMVLDTFVIERGHLRVKAVADEVRNTIRFERSVLASILNHSLKPPVGCGSNALYGRARRLTDTAWVGSKLVCFGMNVPLT